ncbi:MAG: ATP/GTP-binding protein [Sphingobacteriales bacterium]|nr:ATP/GTP-binding protein [Sphingobacteriales bacterium]
MKNNIFKVSTLGILITGSRLFAQEHTITKIWETQNNLKVPESVLYEPKSKVLYFSNIDGTPDGKDGKGSIGKLSLDGKTATEIVTDLNAPKGLGIYKNVLYTADIDQVVAIDLNTNKVINRYPVEGAAFLNDITINLKGKVFVSDSGTGKIHVIEDGKVSTYLEELKEVNGLLSVKDDLYILASGSLWKADKSKKLTQIAHGLESSTDGIEQTKNGDFIVSSWNGMVYYVKADGSKETLLNTTAEQSKTADIGFDVKNNIIYVPTFFKNTVAAYQLK